MPTTKPPVTRRTAIKTVVGLAAGAALGNRLLYAEDATGRRTVSPGPVAKPIPSSGELLPVVGAGTMRGWDVPERVREFLDEFAHNGATMLYTTPWFSDHKAVPNIGAAATELGLRKKLFMAVTDLYSKDDLERTKQQLGTVDVGGNNVDLPWLRELKQAKQIRYISTYSPEDIETEAGIDVLLLNGYSLLKREAEARILPLAKDKGVAVVARGPFQDGAFFQKVGRHPLPTWAAELGIASWAQFALKYVVSHPAVVGTVPGTTKREHLRDNLSAAYGPLPDEATRRKMAAHIDGLP